ncbi:GTP-binding protein Rheb-like isoform X2 [Ostrea edulis]|uniref:GTP-binding protein Rheb-like isoform X2 n=1 Tax=Ostrea edulis TaxID=37623 RepID=UPI002094C00D|nr:GTP-binding protein Rheb-like isoform X2 [Ostrea edulis]
MPAKQRRVALMGFRSVGKSSVTIQFVENHFVDSYDPTIENTFQKTLKIRGQEYSLQVIDTAGQDEYSVLPQSYFVNIDGYVLVYSVNSKKSFEVVKFVYDKLLDMKGTINGVPVVLVGNKCDLATEREVTYEEGKRLADSWKVSFMETSAKEHHSVTEVFTQIILAIERAEGNNPDQNKSCILS